MAARKKHTVTNESKQLVRALAAVGIRFEDIATKLDISADTLTRKYRRELDLGRIDANAAIGNTLYQQAKNGNTTAAIFWLKTRANWRETTRLDHTSEDGSMTPQPTRIEIIGVEPGSRDVDVED